MPSSVPPHARGGRGGAYVFDTAAIAWRAAGKEGIAQKTVRMDRERGQYLGLIGFEPMVRSGLHQHRGVATSFFADGGLTDHYGAATLHQAGINLAGATHDAIAYQRTLLVSRLEGPVVYPPEEGPVHELHAGARSEAFTNPAPERAPEFNVDVDRQPVVATAVAGLTRRMIFDYAHTDDRHRMFQWSLLPQTVLPAWRSGALVEFWVRGGALVVNGRPAHANCFVIVEPDAQVELASPFGALVIGWAEAPLDWSDGPARADPFGF